MAIGWLTNNFLNFSVKRGTLCSAPHGFFLCIGPITDMLLLAIFLSMITILLRKYKRKTVNQALQTSCEQFCIASTAIHNFTLLRC